jgi:hypothetical protein
MPDILAVTAWDVPEHGFRWASGYAFGRTVSSTLDRFLVPKTKAEQAWHRYWPLADAPALFRAFADLDLTEEAIAEFADKYGCLGTGQDIEIPSAADPSDGPPPDGGFESDFSKGESLAMWVDEILGMRHTVRVWEALQTMSVEELQTWFHMEDFHGALRASYDGGEPVRRAVYAHERLPQTTLQEFQWYLSHAEIRRLTHEPATVALSFVRTMVEARLREQTSARLTYVDDEPDQGPLQVSLVPKTLLGAIWMQAASAIEANRAFGKCRQCHCWFELPPELRALGKRADLGYCSSLCREESDERDRRGDVAPATPKAS